MGASFRRNDFGAHLGGDALLVIGQWLPWIPSTNHNNACPPKRFQKSLKPELVLILP